MQQPQRDSLIRLQTGFGYSHLVIYTGEKFGDKVDRGHGGGPTAVEEVMSFFRLACPRDRSIES